MNIRDPSTGGRAHHRDTSGNLRGLVGQDTVVRKTPKIKQGREQEQKQRHDDGKLDQNTAVFIAAQASLHQAAKARDMLFPGHWPNTRDSSAIVVVTDEMLSPKSDRKLPIGNSMVTLALTLPTGAGLTR